MHDLLPGTTINHIFRYLVTYRLDRRWGFNLFSMFIKLCVLISELLEHMHFYLLMTVVINPFCSTLRYKPDLDPAGFGTKDCMFLPWWATLWMEKCTKFWRRSITENWRCWSKVKGKNLRSVIPISIVKTHWILTGYVRNISFETIKEKGW